MRFWLFSLIFMLCSTSIGQQAHPFIFSDTIRVDHRIGGSLDSIDLMFKYSSSTIPGGVGNGYYDNLFTTDWLRSSPNGQRFFSFNKWGAYRYSGIPHIGFAYSFGSQGTQLVGAQYEQGFKGNVMLNIDFEKKRSNGYLRNTNFDHNDVRLKLFKRGNCYSFDLRGSFEKSTVSHNGGVAQDSLADEFPLIFIPVNKDVSELNTQRSRLELVNYFDFLKDTNRAVGVFTSHDLKIKKYRYLESGDLSGFYPVINYDSSYTYDQHQWSQVGNGAGLFLKNGGHYLSAGVSTQFWNFQNLGSYTDTVEIDLDGKYQFIGKRVSLNEDLSLNLVGSEQEMTSDLHLRYNAGRFKLTSNVFYQNLLPEYYQRFGTGNNYFPAQNISKQQLLYIDACAKYSVKKQEVKIGYEYSTAEDNYWFIDSLWRNDTLNDLSFQSIKLGGDLKFGHWTFQPEYKLTINDQDLKIVPAHQLRIRIFVKGGLFKAKRMIAYGGADLSVHSSYSRIGMNAVNSTYSLNEVSLSNNGWSNAHVFGGFQIEEFKFYFRVENIGYFWNDPNLQVINGFPIPSTQFRLGLTWDFFN